MEKTTGQSSRRMFIGKLAAGTAVGVTSLTSFRSPLVPGAATREGSPEGWFKHAKGKHRMVYDASEPHDGFPIIWSWVFYVSNNETGTPDDDMTAMVVLRHKAVPFALSDEMWKKYSLGQLFGINDKGTGKPALRNPYYEPKEGDFPNPAIEGIKRLHERGAMFCACNMALKVYSAMLAKEKGLDAAAVYEDWKKNVLPGIEVVPSGVWAINRAQEHQFAYCYAGG